MKRILITLLSVGWLLPFWLTGYTAISLLRGEIMPRLHGRDPTNSFPFEHFMFQTFTVTCIWLAAAMAFWAWRLSGLMTERKHAA
jgi:hypothetical protein